MKKILFLIISLFFFYTQGLAQSYNILDFGAIPNTDTINTIYIQKAIDSCAANGGGKVYVPAGIFLTGTLQLKSNVNLYLESGGELKGSPNIKDYKEYQLPDYPLYHYGILYTEKANNVSITGLGAINGNEEAFFDFTKAKKIEWGGKEFTRQTDKYRSVTSGNGDGPVVPKERPRQMIIFSECTNVLVRDLQLIKSPFWTLHFADCDGVLASGLKIWTSLETPNSDGLDITSCNNVMVSDCDIRTGDDAIAITGYAHHFELPGYKNLRHKADNITITNCNLQSRSSGIRIGYLDQNTIRNININNVNITNSNRGIGIFVRDEGSVENVTISQVNIETRLHTGDWWGNGEPIHLSAGQGNPDTKTGKIKNITFRDINCSGENGILVYGSTESVIEEIRFDNIKFNFKNSPLNDVAGGNMDLRGYPGHKSLFASNISAFYATHVKSLYLNDVIVKWDNINQDYFKYAFHIKNFEDLKLYDILGSASPSNKELPAVFVENGTELYTNLDTNLIATSKVKK